MHFCSLCQISVNCMMQGNKSNIRMDFVTFNRDRVMAMFSDKLTLELKLYRFQLMRKICYKIHRFYFHLSCYTANARTAIEGSSICRLIIRCNSIDTDLT